MKIESDNGARLELDGRALELRKPDGERIRVQLPPGDAARLELALQAFAANNPDKLN